MEPFYCDDMVTLYAGDCIEVLRQLPDASVDSVVTDPPYGLGFMGKAWDADFISLTTERRRQYGGDPSGNTGTNGGYRSAASEAGRYDLSPTGNLSFQLWCQEWAAECLRVLKPGGHLLAFGGTRTWHRLACAIEDAGFEVRDSIAWMYGSGFPKSLDVSKAIDKAAGAERTERVGVKPGHEAFVGKDNLRALRESGSQAQEGGFSRPWMHDPEKVEAAHYVTAPATPDAVRWSGWGTALKPAHEPIVVARKPLTGTVAANVLEHGVGGLNIDGCRIGTTVETWPATRSYGKGSPVAMTSTSGRVQRAQPTGEVPAGRWPANVILDEDQADALDQQSGTFKGRVGMKQTSENLTFGVGHERERQTFDHGVTDFGGASRFFYVAKAPTRERPKVDGIAHPTVKPLTLMRWLVRLVTPPGGTVLEPFAGSGTTVEAATAEGFKCIAIERELDYLPLILSRITRDEDPDGGQLTFDASA